MEELDLLEKIKEPILKWYQQNKRELPWRREKIHISFGFLKLCFSKPELRLLWGIMNVS